MLDTLRVDFQRLFLSRRYYYSIAGMALALLLNGITYTGTVAGTVSLGECFDEVSFGGFMILFYLLCVVGGGLDYCMDVKNHFMRYTVVRSGLSSYTLSKTIVSAAAGWISSLLGQAIFLGLMWFVLRYINGGTGEEMTSSGLVPEMWWGLLTFSLLGSVLSVLGLFVTCFVPNVFVGITAPVLCYYMVITLTDKYFTNPYILPGCIYFARYYSLFGGGVKHFGYALLVTLCMVLLMYAGIYSLMKRRGEHV